MTFQVLPFTVLLGRYFTDGTDTPEMLSGLKFFIWSFRRAKGITYGKEKAAMGRHGQGQGQECKLYNWFLPQNISGQFLSMEHHTWVQDEDCIWGN